MFQKPLIRFNWALNRPKDLGAGANPEVGRRAAEEDIDSIIRAVKDADVVFLTAGLGGGTGSGALPIIAKALREKDILSVAVVTKPFIFEGKRRMKVAQDALDLLKEQVDSLIVIPNQKLIDVVDQKVSLVNAFNMINGILNQFIRSIADIIAKPGHINVDFADIKTIMKQRGFAVIGTGKASGEDRAAKAARQAVTSPLLDNASISGARGVLLNISGSSNLGLHEVGAAAQIIYEQAHEDASIIMGSVIDESLGEEVTVTVIATGFEQLVTLSDVIQPAIAFKPELTYGEIQRAQEPEPVRQEEPAVQAQQPQMIQAIATEPIAEEPIDLNDLEIPAVMRQLLQKK